MRSLKKHQGEHYEKSVHASPSENMLSTGSQTWEVKALAQIAHLSPPYISEQSNIWDIENSNFLNLKIKLSFLNKLHTMHFF